MNKDGHAILEPSFLISQWYLFHNSISVHGQTHRCWRIGRSDKIGKIFQENLYATLETVNFDTFEKSYCNDVLNHIHFSWTSNKTGDNIVSLSSLKSRIEDLKLLLKHRFNLTFWVTECGRQKSLYFLSYFNDLS